MSIPKIKEIPPLSNNRIAEYELFKSLKAAIEWINKNPTESQQATSKSTTIINQISSVDIYGNTYYPNCLEADQGVTGLGETVKAYIALIGTNKGSLFFQHKSGNEFTYYIFDTDLTIGSNIVLQVENGAKISVNAGTTLTVGSVPEIGINHAFTGSGLVNVDDSISVTGNIKQTGYHEMNSMIEPAQPIELGGRIFVKDDSGKRNLYVKFDDGRIASITGGATNYSISLSGLTVPMPSITQPSSEYQAGVAHSDSKSLTVPMPSISVAGEIV